MNRRVILIVLDGVGCGELPDAASFGDVGSNTLGNVSRWFAEGLALPNLERLGLGNVIPIRGLKPKTNGDSPGAAFGRMAEKSSGKDSTTGHWEMAGLVSAVPFPTYPNGFPAEVIDPFAAAIGRGVLGNVAASGTEIIKQFGEEHLKTGNPIVYTSADSVFQIAAHGRVYPIAELYRICEIARAQLAGKHAVSRVIARPFTGEPGAFTRTAERKDFSLTPTEPTLLDKLQARGVSTIGVGKIGDLFAGRGLSKDLHTTNNADGITETVRQMREAGPPAFVFINLVDFDQVYGHRNDVPGFRRALEEFDARLPEIIAAQREGDLMILTADHGTDPTTPSTDHSREYAPLLVWGEGFRPGVDLGTRATFADLGQTAAEYLGCEALAAGESFLASIMQPAAASAGGRR